MNRKLPIRPIRPIRPICPIFVFFLLTVAPVAAIQHPQDVCPGHGFETLAGGPGLPDQEPPPPGEAPKSEGVEGKEEKKDEKWDVNNPPGPRSEVPIDVDEGTWMAVDVSPDGKEIAFDLLGDIHVLPIAGGEARALTHSIAWEMQPRYSPDGKHIAFTSDQGRRRQHLGHGP